MRRRSFVAALVAMLTVALVGFLPSASARSNGPLREYVVLYEAGSSFAEGRAAVEAAGGQVVEEIASIGVARVDHEEHRVRPGGDRPAGDLPAPRGTR